MEASAGSVDDPGMLQREISRNAAGSTEDIIEDAKAAEQDRKGVRWPEEAMFYQCLRGHGVLLEPEQEAVLDTWAKQNNSTE